MKNKILYLSLTLFVFCLFSIMNVSAITPEWEQFCNISGMSFERCNASYYGGISIVEEYLLENNYTTYDDLPFIDYVKLNNTMNSTAIKVFNSQIVKWVNNSDINYTLIDNYVSSLVNQTNGSVIVTYSYNYVYNGSNISLSSI